MGRYPRLKRSLGLITIVTFGSVAKMGGKITFLVLRNRFAPNQATGMSAGARSLGAKELSQKT